MRLRLALALVLFSLGCGVPRVTYVGGPQRLLTVAGCNGYGECYAAATRSCPNGFTIVRDQIESDGELLASCK